MSFTLPDVNGPKQTAALEKIAENATKPWYKTANGWFSFIAMVASIIAIIIALKS